MEDKEKIDAGFSAMLEKEQAEIDQAVKVYFGKHWPDLSTEEGRNTPMTFTPFAVMRLATYFYHLGKKTKLRNREAWVTRAKKELEEEK
jgi:hypothetical protein